ncbi:MAG: SDR family oxidoreductase [Chryseolinea sp.]
MNRSESKRLNILVIGANGGIGAQVVRRALSQGHSVTAILRNPDKLLVNHDELTIVQGDILRPDQIQSVFMDKDVVISAIGSNSRKRTSLYSDGARHILEAMNVAGITRCFFISASGLDVNPSFNFFLKWVTKNILQLILKEMYKDLVDMEVIIKSSPLHWTIVRPPRLTNGKAKGECRFSVDGYLAHGTEISRADLAYFILDNIDNPAIYRSTVEVGY